MAKQTDQGGDDTSTEQENARQTRHNAKAALINQWGQAIKDVTIRHLRGNVKGEGETQTYPTLSNGETAKPFEVVFITGFASPYDYWWVQFTTPDGATWSCKDNFYCSYSSDDEGTTAEFTLNGDSKNMHVHFLHSSDCDVSINKG
ncbi:MAG: hypothetical protein ACRDSR_16610 [Pseudonocardiaceae bacterium]